MSASTATVTALASALVLGAFAFAVKLVTSEFGGGADHVFTNWPIYVLAVTGPLGYLFNQNALQQGKSLALSSRSSPRPTRSSPSPSASCG